MLNPKVDGDYHGRITVALSPLAAILGVLIGFFFGNPVNFGIAAWFGCICGLFIDPDLDQMMITRSEMRVIDSFPPFSYFFGGWWVGWWLPYARVVPHRSRWSHFPVLSTAIRLIFLAPIAYLGHLVIADLFPSIAISATLVSCWVLGLVISDFGHYARDKWGWEI